MAFKHTSVLLEETVDGLKVKPDGIYVDATLGGGGHAYEVASRLSDKGRFIGIDQDADAIEAAGARLSGFGEKVTIIRSNYCDMKPRLHEIGIDKVDGIVIDLGVSSYQLDTAERGFSYRTDAPLDMRMDQRQTTTAKDIVNDYSEAELYRVIRDYGEDKFAKNIAKHIVMERGKHPIETTGQLNEVIRRAIPMKFQKTSGHPSKRTFQAIRIELNRELDVLRETLDDMIDMLNPLFGSIMITAVFLLPGSSSRSSPLCASLNSRIYFSTMLCSVTSIVDTTVFPFFAAFTVRSTEEALSKYPYSLPSVPLRISLYALSMPIAP